MKKIIKNIIVSSLCLIIAIFSLGRCYGGSFVLGGWQPTMEEAIQSEMEDYPINSLEEGQMAYSIAKNCYETTAYWLFITNSGILMEYSFAYDSNKGYKYNARWEYGHITDPFAYLEEFGKDKKIGAKQLIPNTNLLRGIRVHDGLTLYINGEPTRVTTYEVEFEGQTYSIDYWDLINFDADFDHMEIVLK